MKKGRSGEACIRQEVSLLGIFGDAAGTAAGMDRKLKQYICGLTTQGCAEAGCDKRCRERSLRREGKLQKQKPSL